jgi:hypothetical protein
MTTFAPFAIEAISKYQVANNFLRLRSTLTCDSGVAGTISDGRDTGMVCEVHAMLR